MSLVIFHFQEAPIMQQGSFRFPDDCQDADCDFLVTYQASGNESVVFELSGKGDWAGVGFSEDKFMVSNVDLQNCTSFYTVDLPSLTVEKKVANCSAAKYFRLIRLYTILLLLLFNILMLLISD